MAQKTYTRTRRAHLRGPSTDRHVYAAFMADLLDGVIEATELVDDRPGGRLRLLYDDPDRPGAGRGGTRRS